MAGKLKKFEKFVKKKKRKDQISVLFSIKTPSDDCPHALDHFTVGLVGNKYTKLGKTRENLMPSQGLTYIKIPL